MLFLEICRELKKPLNIKKNRSVQNPKAMPSLWDIDNVISSPRHEDKNDFQEDLYVYMNGYLVDFEEQGPEACNCYYASKSLKNGNVRVLIGLTPNAPKYNCVAAALTPDFKKRHPDYEKHLIKGSKIKVAGYLIYDPNHRGKTANTSAENTSKLLRKTNWVIHPIVSIRTDR